MFENFSLISLEEKYFEETLRLIEESFQYEPTYSFKNDFSFLFIKENFANNKIILDKSKNRVIGHFGICDRSLVYNKVRTSVALMGGICIAKDYRGKGIFDYFFKIILNQVDKKYAMTILWSGEPEIYYKYAFHLAIEQHSFQTDLNSTSPFKKIEFIDKHSKTSIKALYQKYIRGNYITLERNNSHWDQIWQMKNRDIYIYRDNGKILSYFIVNKGQDLKNIIHEIAIDDINKFISPSKDFIIWHPIQSKQLSDQIQFGAILRLNSNPITEKFFSDLTGDAVILKFINNKENIIEFLYNGDVNKISINDFLTGFWGPGKFEEFSKFPTNIYIPGIDSI